MITKQQVLTYFGVSRQAHHQQRHRWRKRQAEEALIVPLVQTIRQQHPRMGGKKVWRKLQLTLNEKGIQVGRDRFFAILKANDLLVPVKRRKTRTTRSGLYRCPNRLPETSINHPLTVWVADITYVTLETGFAYLALLTDAFSRFIVGFDLSRSLAIEGAERSLKQAIKQSPQPSLVGLIHHSDHGVQYTAHTYRHLLAKHQMLASMGEVGNCYENALAERVNGILKLEYGLDRLFVNTAQATLAVTQAVTLYNYDRPHLSLNYATPADVHWKAVT